MNRFQTFLTLEFLISNLLIETRDILYRRIEFMKFCIFKIEIVRPKNVILLTSEIALMVWLTCIDQ